MKTDHQNLNGIATVWSAMDNLLEEIVVACSQNVHLSVLFWGGRMELYMDWIFDWLCS